MRAWVTRRASCWAFPCSPITWGTQALVSSSVKAVFCRQVFQNWKIWLLYPNSQSCRSRMRDLSFVRSFLSLFTSYFNLLLNSAFVLHSELRKCCCLMFYIISLEIIIGYPATGNGTPPVRYLLRLVRITLKLGGIFLLYSRQDVQTFSFKRGYHKKKKNISVLVIPCLIIFPEMFLHYFSTSH